MFMQIHLNSRENVQYVFKSITTAVSKPIQLHMTFNHDWPTDIFTLAVVTTVLKAASDQP